jgi:hypothetical protein
MDAMADMTESRDPDPRGDSTSPGPGLADTAPELAAESEEGLHDPDPGHTEPPSDDERTHEADFAPDGYDDRETDSLPRMPGE